MQFFTDVEKTNFDLLQKHRTPRIAKIIPNNKRTAGSVTITGLKFPWEPPNKLGCSPQVDNKGTLLKIIPTQHTESGEV